MSFLRELQRRNVGRVATAYVVSAWLIVQVVETIFPAFGFSDRAFQTVVIVLAVGFIPTVILAWLFEWTPEGLKRDDEAELSADARLVRARSFDRGIIVVLLLAVAYFAVDKFVLTGTEVDDGFYGTRSIAVMPFEIRSSNPEQQYFADGITDEIRHLLGTIRDLRVIVENSSALLQQENTGIAELWETHRIGHVLQGSVRVSGDRVRVSAQLVETKSETQLWSDVYERTTDSVFRIQDDIARNVLHNLKIELLEPLPNSQTVNPEVFALVQQAKTVYEVRDKDTGERMRMLLSQALALDPTYVPALAWMGVAEKILLDAGRISEQEARKRWRELDAQIEELGSGNAILDYHAAWELFEAGEWEDAAKLFEQSMDKDLTYFIGLFTAGVFARNMGKLETALRLFKHAAAIDPLCYQCLSSISRVQMYRGDVSAALQTRERFRTVAKGGHLDYSMMLILDGRPEDVAEVLAPLDDDAFQKVAMLAMAEYSLHGAGAAIPHLRKLEDLLSESIEQDDRLTESIQHDLAMAYAWMGNKDKAFELLMPLVKKRGFTGPRMLLFHPAWREVRDDPRWTAYREALDMTAERFDAIEFDPWLPE